jgi:putative heme-binding domain-containing protein
MSRSTGLASVLSAVLGVTLTSIASAISSAPDDDPMPHWVWPSETPAENERAVFDFDLVVPDGATAIEILASADNRMVLSYDDAFLLRHRNWERPAATTIADPTPGSHRLRFDCHNEGGPAGLAAIIRVSHPDGDIVHITDGSWRAVDPETPANTVAVIDFGPSDAPRGPWRNPFAIAKATPAEAIIVPEGFEVELLHSARPGEGSWSAMTVDGEGRVIISPQYGPLLRITPASQPGGRAMVERLHDEVGRAHGLLVVGDDLYVNVADDPKRSGGLWRLRDADGDDTYEVAEQLAAYGSGSEHGPHGLRLGPDGRIWMVNGNYATIPSPLREISPHEGWAEDVVLERIWDPRGHAVGLRSPGAVLLRTDLDATEWEIVAGGMRNPYDLDFDANGEPFTYDADMEWDMGTPWYRTPRFIHLVSGGEYGWRSGSAKWPVDAADSFPAVMEMDAGSPTGVASGHRSNFPDPWRHSMLLGDWAYGRVIAVELTPEGGTYRGTLRPFLQGRPFNVTDFEFGPDGALYLTTGGRGSQSGLYRVRWAGDAPRDRRATQAERFAASTRMRRAELEASHRDLEAMPWSDLVDALGDQDPSVRRAARIGVEHAMRAARDGRLDATLDEIVEATRELPAAAGGWDGVLAVLRAGDRASAVGSIETMQTFADEDDSPEGRRALSRAAGLLIARYGPLEPDARAALVEVLDPIFPTGRFDADRGLVEVMVALQAPGTATRALDLIADAATPAEAMHHLHAIRLLDAEGWSDADRGRAVAAIDVASTWSGGASFPGFVDAIRTDLVERLGPEAAAEVTRLAEARRTAAAESAARRFVRAWTVDDFTQHLSRLDAGRSFERGAALFESLQCAACHQVGGRGLAYGPDLTGVGGRFLPRDLLTATIEPARDLSDQYAGIRIETTAGDAILGLPVERTATHVVVAPDPRTGTLRVEVPLADIASESTATPMPAGLLDTASMDEVLDLLAYLRSGGDSRDPSFRSPP